jgi:hypothetical protein
LKNGNLLRQQKNPDRLCMYDTPRGYFASLHLTIFERPPGGESWVEKSVLEGGGVGERSGLVLTYLG